MDGMSDAADGVPGNRPGDAVMILPNPDHSMTDDVSLARPKHLSTDSNSPDSKANVPFLEPSSQITTLQPPQSTHLSQHSPSSTQQHQRFNVLPPLSPPASASPFPSLQPSWSQTTSPTSSAPSNPFYSAVYRPSTPPMPSSAEQSPIVSPAKRFSSGEVKPLVAPTSPRQPLTDEDRLKFTQVLLPFSSL